MSMERTVVQLPCQEEIPGGSAIGNAIEKASKAGHDASAGELRWMRNGTCNAPVFHPSVEEFRDPIAYIRSIRRKAEPFGLCKIVPPYPATTQCFEALRRDAGHTGNIGNLKLTTHQQLVGEKEWEDWNEDRFWGAPERSLKAFHQAADATATKVFGTCLLLPPRRVEEEFWKRMSKPTKANASSLYVEYGDHVTGTGFLDVEGDPLGSSLWNLNKFHSSADARSPLKLLQTPIAGVTTPHVYHGALFSTSSWLVEDLYLLSLSFLHIGAPKTWYAVPAQYADAFEQVVQDKVYGKMCSKMREMGASENEVKQKVLETLARKTTVLSPEHLIESEIPITRTDQAAGEFVVTFPRTYHLGFSHGINLGESINFALTEWYEHGTDAALRLTFLRKSPALPVEQMACVDMLTLAESLKSKAEAADGQDFRGWLLGPGASIVAPTSVPLLVSFCRLIRWYHRNISKFLADGLTMHRQAIDISVPCCATGELMHVAAIMLEASHEPISLRHCLHTSSKDPSTPCKGVLLLHEKWEVYQELAQIFGELCLQQGWGGTDTERWKSQGLTDRLHIPSSKTAPCWEDLSTSYSWQLDDSSPLHSAWSSNEFLPRASDKDGALLPVFEAVYPDAAVDVPVVAAPSKTTAGAKRSSSKGGRGGKKGGKALKEPAVVTRAQTPEITDIDPSPHATTAKSTGQGTPADGTPNAQALGEGDGPRKRPSRTSKNAAMASWKANKMLDEDDEAEEDSRSEDGTRPSRRAKKMKRDESLGALQTAKTGPGLAKVYSNAASVVPQDVQADRLAGKDSALSLQGQNSLQQQVSQQQQQQNAQQQQVPQAKMPQQQQQQLNQQGQAWSGGAGGVGRPRSQSLSPISNYNAFHTEQDRWRRDVSEVNNQWVQKLQECAKTNADVQNLLRYYMSLPDVSHVYPVSQDARSMGPIAPAATAASGGAPSTGMGGGTGAASVGALQNGSGALQGSGALSGSTLPLQSQGSAQRRNLQGQAINAWPPNSARKESLHNGPISAQDLATSIRGRPASSDDSRQNGGKGRSVMGPNNMPAPGVKPSAAAGSAAGGAAGNPQNPAGGPSTNDGRSTRSMPGGAHRSSATNLPTTDPGPSLAQEQSASHASPSVPMQPGGPMPSLGLQMMDGQPQSPMLPLTPHSPADTPRSGLDDIINGTRNSDFHDFLSSLGDQDDVDLGMEF